jgi:hypothetical protein
MSETDATNATFGLLAQFANPESLVQACAGVREEGFSRWDAHTPFPIHGLDRAMGVRRSWVSAFVLVMGLGGAALGMLLQWWVATTAYPLVISGKPFFSWPAFVPVTFEVGVLFGALAAVFGMLGLNQLPMLYHPLFNSKQFEKVSDDGFFLSIEAGDPKFDERATVELLERAGALEVELVGN